MNPYSDEDDALEEDLLMESDEENFYILHCLNPPSTRTVINRDIQRGHKN
jgi:hypothetical protein